MSVPSLVVLLHGVGANGADLVPLGQRLRQLLDAVGLDVRFTAPDAPHVFDRMPGVSSARQWFSLDGIDLAALDERIVQARAGFDAVLADAVASAGFAGRPERVVLLGFSQGAMMTFDALADGRFEGAGAIGFAGMLGMGIEVAPTVRGAKVLVVHGEEDEVIPAIAGRQAAARLREAGASVDLLVEPGVAHEISEGGIRQAAAFLASVLK